MWWQHRGRIHAFNFLLGIAASVALGYLLGWFLLDARGSCYFARDLGTLLFVLSTQLSYQGHFLPLLGLTGALMLSARKGTLGGRFCGILALVLGAMLLMQPPAKAEGALENLQCTVTMARLPWSLALGAAWVAVGTILILRHPLSGIGSRPLSRWVTRSAGVLLLLFLGQCTLPDADLYSYPYVFSGPRHLGRLLWETQEALDHWLRPLHMVAVGPSLMAAALALALVGVRQGTIGISGLRIAFLTLGGMHLVVILVNLSRLAMAGSLGGFLTDLRELHGLAFGFLSAAVWLGLGLVLLLIRRDWWDRPAAPPSPAVASPFETAASPPP